MIYFTREFDAVIGVDVCDLIVSALFCEVEVCC